jgi:hypothetical protein
MSSSTLQATLRKRERMIHTSKTWETFPIRDPKTGVIREVHIANPGITYRKDGL